MDLETIFSFIFTKLPAIKSKIGSVNLHHKPDTYFLPHPTADGLSGKLLNMF